MSTDQYWKLIPPHGWKGTRLQWLEYNDEFNHVQRSPSPEIKKERRQRSYLNNISTEDVNKAEKMKLFKVAINNIRYAKPKTQNEQMKSGGSYGKMFLKNMKTQATLITEPDGNY